ncbi:DsbA family protein [Streptomyces mexicanus]|uniref:DsbA family protein n=1 Tax=Streptomyces mexicanus TaxID=178566 RepID=UPI00367C76FC
MTAAGPDTRTQDTHRTPIGPATAATATAAAAVAVVVYSDIGCPWASLALYRLRRAAAAEGVALAVDHRAFPLELFNGRPTPKGILDPEVAALADLEPALGWRAWSAPESGYPVTMLPAMEAVQAAKTAAVGGLAASDQLDAALRHAFYAESRCVSVHSEIVAIARTCPLVDADALDAALRAGSHRAALFAQWEAAKGPEVQGSPHFFFPDGTDAHNPGVAFTWPAGTERPVVTANTPDYFTALVRRLAGRHHPAPAAGR